MDNEKNAWHQYDLLSQISKAKGNYKEALASHEQYVIFKDSIFNADNKETIKNLEDKREIELRDKEIKINKLSLDAKEKQKWYLLSGLGLLAVIGGLLFYQSRKRKQTNDKLQLLNTNLDTKNLELDQANKAKTRFFSILNHDLRGPVANLIFFLQLQKDSPEMLDEESTKRMQDKTMTGAENLLASMEDILQWSKSQMENFKPQPKNLAINQLFDDTKKVFSGYMNIKFEYENPDNIEVFTDENYLKTIVRNLTSNAINVLAEFVTSSLSSSLKTGSVERIIIWKAWQENEKSFLSITDNGPGAHQEKLKALFDESEVSSSKSGLGLHLIRDMAKAIDCEISVDSEIGVGTTFVLKL
jgi:signal transduction histidine kinase